MRNTRAASACRSIVHAALALALGGCAVHQWAPGPGRTMADLAPAEAQCNLMATHPGGGFSASGDLRTVVIATAVYAIGSAIRGQNDFNDCMQTSGFLVADGNKAAPLQPVAAVPLAPIPPPQVVAVPLATIPVPPPVLAPQPVLDTGRWSPPAAPTERATQAVAAADTWLRVQDALNEVNGDKKKRGLYGALCSAGDQSSCIMASALEASSRPIRP